MKLIFIFLFFYSSIIIPVQQGLEHHSRVYSDYVCGSSIIIPVQQGLEL